MLTPKRISLVLAALITLAIFAIAGAVPVLAGSINKETLEKISGQKSAPKTSKHLSGRTDPHMVKPVKKTLKKININTADRKALMQLPGIGPKTADSILMHLKRHGKFKQTGDLLTVKGVGKKTLARIKPYIRF